MFVESLLFLANDEEIQINDRFCLKDILKDCEKDPYFHMIHNKE